MPGIQGVYPPPTNCPILLLATIVTELLIAVVSPSGHGIYPSNTRSNRAPLAQDFSRTLDYTS